VYPLFSDLRTSGVVIYPLKSISFLTVFVSKRVHFVKNRGSRMTPLGFYGGLQSPPSLVYVQTPQKQKPPKTSKTDLVFTVFRRKTEKTGSFLEVFGGFRFWGVWTYTNEGGLWSLRRNRRGCHPGTPFLQFGAFWDIFCPKNHPYLSRYLPPKGHQNMQKTRKTSKNDPKTLSQGRCYVQKVWKTTKNSCFWVKNTKNSCFLTPKP